MAVQREFNWPINPVTVNSGPIQYETNGVPTLVNIDTVTPSNSTPLPVIQYSSSGLPADYATAANQTTEIGHLANIETNTTGISLEATQLLVKSDLDTIVTNTTGLATEATLSAAKTDLDSINSKTPALGQALMAASVPVAIASNQSAIPVSAASLPLPSGAATEATLLAVKSDLDTVVTNTTGLATEVTLSAAKTDLDSIVTSTGDLDTNLGAKADAAATTDTGTFSVIAFIKRGMQNWTSLLAKIPALGQALMAASMPVAIASNQSAIPIKSPVNTSGSIVNTSLTGTTASSASAPANAVGFILEAPSINTDNINWCIGGTASTTVGMLLEPGRDTGFVPCAAAISVCSTVSGTNAYSIQWILSA